MYYKSCKQFHALRLAIEFDVFEKLSRDGLQILTVVQECIWKGL
jgi:hypothetical protein